MAFSDDDAHFMKEALAFARIAFAEQEVPSGPSSSGRANWSAGGATAGSAWPTRPTMPRSRRSGRRRRPAGTWRLDGATLYATLEPCPMCAGAAVNARIARIVYGCADPKAGYCGTLGNIPQDARLNHRCEVEGGLLAEESAELLQLFFRARR